MRTSLVVQWLRLESSNAGDMGLIPGMGTKIPHAAEPGQKKKRKRRSRMEYSVWLEKNMAPAFMELSDRGKHNQHKQINK